MATSPTTQRAFQQGFGGVDPHAESHEADGSDPVLGPIRFLGSIGIDSLFNFSGETTFIDSTLTLTNLRTRGGQLMIMFNGTVSISQNLASSTGARFQCTVDSTAVTTSGGTDVVQVLQVRADGTDPGVLGIAAPCSIIWFTTPDVGAHTITIQAVVNDAADNAQINAGANLIVFELLPIRRV